MHGLSVYPGDQVIKARYSIGRKKGWRKRFKNTHVNDKVKVLMFVVTCKHVELIINVFDVRHEQCCYLKLKKVTPLFYLAVTKQS